MILFTVRFLNLLDRCLFHRNTAVFVVAKLYDNIFVSDIDHDAIKSTGSQNAVTNLYRIDKRWGRIIKKYMIPNQNTTITTSDIILAAPCPAIAASVCANNKFIFNSSS